MSEPKRNGADRSMLNALLVIEVAQKRGRRGGFKERGNSPSFDGVASTAVISWVLSPPSCPFSGRVGLILPRLTLPNTNARGVAPVRAPMGRG